MRRQSKTKPVRVQRPPTTLEWIEAIINELRLSSLPKDKRQ